MKTLVVLFTALSFTFLQAVGQGKVNFVKESHDFGEIPEGRMASHEFQFVNTGDAPLIISNVQASCGCTTPFWTKEPVMPGKTGVVKATFNSTGRPGPFNKSITVTSNAAEATKIITFKGVVLRKDQMPTVSEEQKKNSAKMDFERTAINLGKLEVNQTAVARFPFTNTGKSLLEVYDVSAPSLGIKWTTNKPSYQPGEKGVLEITYQAHGNGEVTDNVTVTSTDYGNYFSKLSIKAKVSPASEAGSLMRGGNGVSFK